VAGAGRGWAQVRPHLLSLECTQLRAAGNDERPVTRLVFDHGTLVLRASRAATLDVGALLWDSRIAAYRAPAHRYAQLSSELSACGVQFEDSVLRVASSHAAWSPVALRPYQQAALASWTRERRGLVVLPTGSGKTRLACAAIALCRAPALCLVPTRTLLHQWANELSKYCDGPVGVIGDGRYQLEPVTVATFESAYRLMSRIGNRFAL
jgi:hypothetical protein